MAIPERKAYDAIDEFSSFVDEQNEDFLDPNFQRIRFGKQERGDFNFARRNLRRRARGEDPLVEYQRQQALARSGEFFGRRGGGNTTAALNQGERISTDFDFRQLAGRDAAVSGIADLAERRFGIRRDVAGFNNQAESDRLGALQQAIENAAIDPALLIELLNVQSAGTPSNQSRPRFNSDEEKYGENYGGA
jgi:hypothetical protein